jgi:hypothetical protein
MYSPSREQAAEDHLLSGTELLPVGRHRAQQEHDHQPEREQVHAEQLLRPLLRVGREQRQAAGNERRHPGRGMQGDHGRMQHR